MDLFFLAEPIDLSELKTKDTFNKNPKTFHNYLIRTNCLRDK